MRHILIAAAALAIGGLVSPAANAQSSPPYVAGGPVKVGAWCAVDTDKGGNSSYGYYAPCGQQAVASAPRRKR